MANRPILGPIPNGNAHSNAIRMGAMPFQLLLAALISQVAALDNGLALTPPMG